MEAQMEAQMDATTVISLVISIISLAAAVYIGVKQYLTQRKANNVPAFELLKQIEEPALLDNLDFITGKLKDYDPDQGLIGMPAEDRKKVLAGCYFFQHMAMLMYLGLIDELAFTAYFGARTVAVWAAVEPFARKERILNPVVGSEFLRLLEVFAEKAERIRPGVGEELLRNWQKRGTDRWTISHIFKQPSGRLGALDRADIQESSAEPGAPSTQRTTNDSPEDPAHQL